MVNSPINENKKCKDCCKVLSIKDFYKGRISSSGKQTYQPRCKECHKSKSIEWRDLNPLQYKNIRGEYNSKNQEKIREYSKNYDSTNSQKKYYIKNKSKFLNYKKKKRKEDPLFKLKENIRKRIYSCLRFNVKGKIKYLGCSVEEYKLYLEQQFNNNMNWDNYGDYWEIDHIKPLFTFNLEIECNLYEAFHYSNTRPLEKTLNQSRPKKFIRYE